VLNHTNPCSGISVLICCYNAAWVLPRTLVALSRQKFSSDFGWEICIIDNNSHDSTAECVRRFIQKNSDIDVSLITEKQQGLSYARIAGYQAAKFPILIYCDDDTLLCEDYLQKAFDFMRDHPQTGLCGGCGAAVFESEPDARILPYLDRYATGPQGQESTSDITERGFVFGAGMVVRKSVMDAILNCGFAFSSLGRTGKMLTGGEDVELGNAIRAAGYRIHYFAHLKYEHILPARRLTWDYLNQMAYGNGYSSVVMPWPKTLFSYKSHPVYVAIWTCAEFLKRGIPVWLGGATQSQELDFAAIRGAVKGVLAEFFGLFEKRRKARGFYRKLMAYARKKNSI
jgi:glycosyltransferase involved in cell wall biosynthesis